MAQLKSLHIPLLSLVLILFVIESQTTVSAALQDMPVSDSKFLNAEIKLSNSKCNEECLSFCLSYFPTTECVQTCGCSTPSYINLLQESSLYKSRSAQLSLITAAVIVADTTTTTTTTTTQADISNCVATCNLKCKSETNEKKDACVTLCVNQCKASYDLQYAEKYKQIINGQKKNDTTATTNTTNATTVVDTSTNATSATVTNSTTADTTTTGSTATATPTADTANSTATATDTTSSTTTTETAVSSTDATTATTNTAVVDTTATTSSADSTISVLTTTPTQEAIVQQTSTEVLTPTTGNIIQDATVVTTDTAATSVVLPLSNETLALFSNPEVCKPTCISDCGVQSLKVTDDQLTTCFKECLCSLPTNSAINVSFPVAKNFYSMYLADQRANILIAPHLKLAQIQGESLVSLQENLYLDNEKYSQIMRELNYGNNAVATNKSQSSDEGLMTSLQLLLIGLAVICLIYLGRVVIKQQNEKRDYLRWNEEALMTNACYHLSRT